VLRASVVESSSVPAIIANPTRTRIILQGMIPPVSPAVELFKGGQLLALDLHLDASLYRPPDGPQSYTYAVILTPALPPPPVHLLVSGLEVRFTSTMQLT
jgi:hypothetical protein